MRRALISLGVAVPLALAPLAVAGPGGGSDHPPGPTLERPDRAEGPKAERPAAGAHYVLRAIVAEDATAESVEVDVLGGNVAMRGALGGADDLTVALDESTVFKLKGRALRGERKTPARAGKKNGKGEDGRRARRKAKRHLGTYEDLTAGDRITVRFRAEPGTAATALPAARLVVDHGPPKPVAYRLRGVLVGDATQDGAEITVASANRHMRRALDGATTFSATFGETTRIRLAGAALAEVGDKRFGTYADLTAGDRVVVKLRAPRGTALANLPAVHRVFDLGPAPQADAPEE
jgi:hypothetical protein